MRMMREGLEQEALFRWAEYEQGRHPELGLMYHVPNGGSRHPKEAANLKRQGVKPGVPDVCLPVARGGYHGLYIEMKAGKNKATEHQKQWMAELNEQGYLAVVCYGWQEAADVLKKYLGLRDQR